MIVTITLNPAVDCYYRVNSVERNITNTINSTEVTCGGKGINVSKFLSLLKTESIATGFLMSEDEEMFINSFSQLTDDNFIVVPGRTRRNIKVIDNSGNLYEFNDTNRIDPSRIDAFLDNIGQYNDEKNIIVISGSLPDGAPKNTYCRIIEKLNKCRIILDASSDALRGAFEFKPMIIKPTVEEFGQLIGIDAKDDPKDTAKKCQEILDDNQIMVVSNNNNGCMYIQKHKTLIVKGIETTIKNSVGAGDSICACIAFGLENGNTIEEIAILAGAVAAVVVSDYTDSTFNQLVNEMKRKVELEEV